MTELGFNMKSPNIPNWPPSFRLLIMKSCKLHCNLIKTLWFWTRKMQTSCSIPVRCLPAWLKLSLISNARTISSLRKL